MDRVESCRRERSSLRFVLDDWKRFKNQNLQVEIFSESGFAIQKISNVGR